MRIHFETNSGSSSDDMTHDCTSFGLPGAAAGPVGPRRTVPASLGQRRTTTDRNFFLVRACDLPSAPIIPCIAGFDATSNSVFHDCCSTAALSRSLQHTVMVVYVCCQLACRRLNRLKPPTETKFHPVAVMHQSRRCGHATSRTAACAHALLNEDLPKNTRFRPHCSCASSATLSTLSRLSGNGNPSAFIRSPAFQKQSTGLTGRVSRVLFTSIVRGSGGAIHYWPPFCPPAFRDCPNSTKRRATCILRAGTSIPN
nr:hypothetical protein CFP56_66811 [Quercus suber]